MLSNKFRSACWSRFAALAGDRSVATSTGANDCPIGESKMNQRVMNHSRSRLPSLALLAAVVGGGSKLASAQVQLSVGAGQPYTTIQAAVNACPTAGCVISLTDTVYAMPREVWIEGKTNLTIQAAPALELAGIRPRLHLSIAPGVEFTLAGTAVNPTDPLRPAGWKKWPTGNVATVGGALNTSNIYSTNGFQHNGYVVIINSTNITIDGIAIDGTKPTTFVNTGVWSGKYDVFFGNVGINLFLSKNVSVRNTEILNCFSAFYFYNRNVGGAFAMPNVNDLDVSAIVPYSQFGKVGKHLIEKNYIHNNWYGVYDESEWDLGSVIRYNIFNNNFNTQFAQNKDSSSDANNMTGGFMYEKDNSIVPHKIYNNTINGSSVVFGLSYDKSGVQQYFYNNLVTGWNHQGINATMLSNDRQMLSRWQYFIYNNTFELVSDTEISRQLQSFSSGNVNDSIACQDKNPGNKAPCYLTFNKPVNVLTSTRLDQWIWNGWNVFSYNRPITFTGLYTLSTGITDTFLINPNQSQAWVDTFHVGGIIQYMQGLGTTKVDVSSQLNYWADTIPYQSKIAGRATFFAPVWDSTIVKNTVLDQGWVAAGTRDADGSLPDRGAVPKAQGNLISALNLEDQTIVKLNTTNRTVSFPYCLDGEAGTWSNVSFTTNVYFSHVAAAFTQSTGTSDPYPQTNWSIPVNLTPTGATPVVGSCGTYTANLPVAPTDSLARFDLIAQGTLNGVTVKSSPGVWIWRKAAYELDAWFTDAKGDTVTSVRVGDQVQMHVIGRSTTTGQAVALNILVATPDHNTFLANDSQITTGDILSTNVPLGGQTFPVYFTQTGTVTITLAGLNGTLPVPGSAQIIVRPGLPYKAVWELPPSYSLLDHSKPLDSNVTTIPQGISQVELQVVDSFGNDVDTSSNFTITTANIDPNITSIGFAGTATGPFTNTNSTPVTLTTDATGKIQPFIDLVGVQGQKFWGFSEVVGKTVVDSGLMAVGKALDKLYFVPASAIDTFINTPVKVHVMISKDGTTPDVSSAQAGYEIYLSNPKGTQYYASATSTTPIDSVALVAGAVDLWVMSATPITSDTLKAYNLLIGSGFPALFAPVSFRLPPVPPTPTLKSALFQDASCTGAPDSILVKFDPAGAHPTLGAGVHINAITITAVNGTVVSLDSTAVHVSADSASLVITLPSGNRSAFSPYNPAATIQISANLNRAPAADTVVVLNATPLAVTDGIGPRPVSAAIVENSNTGTAPDTLKVNFSEPVTYSGGVFPFQIFSASGTPVPATGLAVNSATGSGTNSLTFVVTGNTSSKLTAGDVLAIAPNTGLTDIAGNGGRYAQCVLDTALVVLQPVAVPIVSAWVSDVNGDGKADLVTVIFRRAFQKPSEAPDSLVVSNWIGAPTTKLPWSAADSIGPATYTFPIPFPEGATVGGNTDGSGSILLAQGPIRRETSELVDSVPPVAVGVAKLGHGTTKDTLTVTVSEPVKAGSGTITLGKKSSSGADVPLGLGTASGTVLTFLITPGTVLVGDSLRMSITGSALVAADNGQAPAASGNAPYVPVVGGDGIPDSAIVLDLNGDGTADAIKLVYASPLNGNPSFTFTWGGKTITVDSNAYGKSLKGTTGGIIKVSGFPALVTAGPGNGTTQSLVAGSPTSVLPFPLIDGVAPVLDSVYVTYGQAEGAPDTVRFKVSEPLGTLPTVSTLLTIERNGTALPFVPSDPTAQILPVNSTTYEIICDSCVDGNGSYGLPGYGDSAKLAKGLPDAVGNDVGVVSRWVPVLTGPHPVRYFAGVYPSGGVFVVSQGSTQPAVVQNLPAVTAWVLPVNADSTGSWSAVDATTNGGTSTLDAATAKGAMLGVTLTLNTSFDGQFIFYDNLGVYAGKIDVTTDIKDLTSKGLVSPTNGKYTMVIGLHDSNARTLASGVYMARVISFSEQMVNGVLQRVMIQNKLFKFGYKNTGK